MFRRPDLNDIFMAVEEAVGMNAGNETFPWEIEAIIPFYNATGSGERYYYVIVQQFSSLAVSGHPFLPVLVTIYKTSPARHAATLVTGSAATTYDAAIAAVSTLVAANSPEVKSGPGPLAGFA